MIFRLVCGCFYYETHMRKILFFGLGSLLLFALACVSPKVHNREKLARTAAEAREKVLVKFLEERKAETATLTTKVADLSKTIGSQEVDIRNLNTELNAKTRSLGESSSKLVQEKTALEASLRETKAALGEKTAQIDKFTQVAESRKTTLAALFFALSQGYQDQIANGVEINQAGELISLLLPDKLLFEPSGLNLSAGGKNLLKPFSEFLAVRPELSVDVVAHTDNNLPPKEKSLRDTWEWSLQRATNVVRLLTREYNINANQLTPVGRGEYYPLTSNETPEGRQKNRRTILLLRPVLPDR
jgi:chemotaxis protein MotB